MSAPCREAFWRTRGLSSPPQPQAARPARNPSRACLVQAARGSDLALILLHSQRSPAPGASSREAVKSH